MGCLRSWLIEKAECPTCRKPIQLDKQPNEERINRRIHREAVLQRAQARRQRNLARRALGLPADAENNMRPNEEEELAVHDAAGENEENKHEAEAVKDDE